MARWGMAERKKSYETFLLKNLLKKKRKLNFKIVRVSNYWIVINAKVIRNDEGKLKNKLQQSLKNLVEKQISRCRIRNEFSNYRGVWLVLKFPNYVSLLLRWRGWTGGWRKAERRVTEWKFSRISMKRGRRTQKVKGEWKGKKNIVSVNRGAELYIRERSHLAICQADANLGGTCARARWKFRWKSSPSLIHR